jgi:hypothetical protein
VIGRRQFLTLFGGAAVAWPLAARAQQTGKLPTIGYLGTAAASAWAPWTAAFVQRLHELGWIEGRTIAIQYRWAEGHNERLADIARFEDYVTRQGTKILKLDRRELPTPPRRIHRKACGNCSNSGVPPGRWRRAEAPTSSRHRAFRSVADVDPIIAGPNDAGVVGVAPVVVAPASRRDGKASASKVGDANASADHGTAEAGKPSSTETATKRGTTEATT